MLIALALPASAMALIVAEDDVFVGSPFKLNPQGRVESFVNQGFNSHNVTAQGKGPDGQPLFRSGTLAGIDPADPYGPTESVPVRGTQYLSTGNYPFLCTLHAGMSAVLEVGPGGKPVPRPDIEVSVVSGKLSKVAKKGKLVVRVRALTRSDDIALVATLGKLKLGGKGGLDLAAKSTRTLALKLRKAAKKKLKKRRKAKVKVRGTVPFGAPDTAKRVLK